MPLVGTHNEVRMACGIDVEKTEFEHELVPSASVHER